MNKPALVKCGQDIPLKLKEGLELNETLAANERILLYCPNVFFGEKWRQQGRYIGLILTNIRFFQYHDGKVSKYIFLNDLRFVKVTQEQWRKFLSFQLVNGQEKQIRIYNNIVLPYFLDLFGAILTLDVSKLSLMLLSDKERIRNDIWNIIRANINVEELFVHLAENLWHVNAVEGEQLEEFILRVIGKRKRSSRMNRLWENSLRLKSVRKDLVAWTKEAGLNIPPDMDTS